MIGKLLANYRKLKKREKILVILFVTVISATAYYQIFHKPLVGSMRTYMLQIEKLKVRLTEVKSRYPEVSEEEKRVEALNTECTRLLLEIGELENNLPSKAATSRLIGELTRLAKDVKLESIRQRIDSGEEYSRIFVELKFDAPYTRIARYIKNVETMSPFLKIEELEISEPQKKKAKSGTSARLVISSLLGDVPVSEQLKAREIEEESFEFRDIFVSKARSLSAKPKVDMKLEGITYNAEVPTSIIDGEVVREGSQIGGLTVKKILPDAAILTDGVDDYILNMER